MASGRLQVAVSAALLLALLSNACPSVLASVLAVGVDVAGVSAQDFKALAAVATSGSPGGKRALLQSSGFSQDFFNILEPILVGDTGQTARHACAP